jgi:hypothetical protein
VFCSFWYAPAYCCAVGVRASCVVACGVLARLGGRGGSDAPVATPGVPWRSSVADRPKAQHPFNR